jgi:2-dehydropantoate 2-reductase
VKRLPLIVVYGAGLVGSYLGGRLHGHAQLRLIVRPRLADVLNEHGLGISDLHGHREHIAAEALDIHTHPAAASEAELVLVTVKSSATADVAAELCKNLAPNAIVISFQNGMHNTERLREALPTHTVLAGMVPFNVIQPTPGVFHQASSGALIVEDSPALVPFLSMFDAAGLALQLRSDIQAVMWGKLLLNLNNALNALSDLPLREEMAQRTWRRCLALLQSEALHVLRSAGIEPARITSLPANWLPFVLRLPDAVFSRLASRMLAIDPSARSSTWEDLQAGRPTEIDYINGEVVALAATHGLRTPANERLTALIHAAERAPTRWDGDALLAELRAAR